MLHDSIYMKFHTHLWKKKNQNRGDRTDWKGQAGTFWGDAYVLPTWWACTTQVQSHLPKLTQWFTFRTLSNGTSAGVFGVICINVCNLLHMHPLKKWGGGSSWQVEKFRGRNGIFKNSRIQAVDTILLTFVYVSKSLKKNVGKTYWK